MTRLRAEFARNKSRRDGLQRICKACKRLHDARSYAAHKAERLAASAAWKQANRAEHNRMARESRHRRRDGLDPLPPGRKARLAPISVLEPAQQPPRICLTCGLTAPEAVFRRTQGRHADRCAACDDALKTDPIEIERVRALARERSRRHAQRHPEQKRERTQRRRALQRGAAVNDFTEAEWRALVCLYQGRCAYCDEHAANLTRDHVVPLAKGGGHTLGNIVPACLACNSAKKDADDWEPSPPPLAGPLCACGCGLPAPIATRNDPKRGYVKGQARRFVNPHQTRPPGLARRMPARRPTKVSDEQVAAIIALKGKRSQRLIASEFGVSQAQVSHIMRGRRRHTPLQSPALGDP